MTRWCGRRYFNPLPSCEGRQFLTLRLVLFPAFQSTPLMRGETQIVQAFFVALGVISIHSPHARGDDEANQAEAMSPYISIHSPHARGDEGKRSWMTGGRIFQSTPLMRGETARTHAGRGHLAHFNPLPSCEGRPEKGVEGVGSSIFQSTPLMRGETRNRRRGRPYQHISIHSPHARGDTIYSPQFRSREISIHSPHARGDSINLQKSFWIQGSLYNKNIKAHFLRL